MTKGKLIILPGNSVIRNLPSKSSLVYKKRGSPIRHEINRVVLRSLAYRFMLMRNFGRGDFSWQSADILSQRYFRTLKEYPEPPSLSTYWKKKSNGEYGLAVPAQELEAGTHDSRGTLMAKREAILRYFSKIYAGMVTFRPPHYREIFDPNTPQNPDLPRTLSVDDLQVLFKSALNALRTHLTKCSPQLAQVLEEYVLNPSLPFNVELPQ